MVPFLLVVVVVVVVVVVFSNNFWLASTKMIRIENPVRIESP
jgi:hypothetical protein